MRSAVNKIGRQALALHLKVPEDLLMAWIDGHATMPDRKLLLFADLLDKLADTPRLN